MRPRPSYPRGFALVIVLWSLGGLALLGSQITGTARVQLRLADHERDRAVVEAAADGAMRQAMFVLLKGGVPGTVLEPLRFRIGEVEIKLASEDQAGKINPNSASSELMRRLLIALGVDPPGAARLAGEVTDWRDRTATSSLGGPKIDQYRRLGLPYGWSGRRFADDDEVGLVADMTPAIMARLRPWLSIYHEGTVTGANTPAQEAAAVTPGASELPFVSHNRIMRVTAEAVLGGRARFVRSGVLRVRKAPGGLASIQVLTWE